MVSFAEAQDLNRTPDCSQAVAVPDRLWPPNYKYAAIHITGVSDPDNDAVTITTSCIVQDEPVNWIADSFTWQDERVNRIVDRFTWQDGKGLGTDSPKVRAERSWFRDGRVYHIVFQASDSEGAVCSGQVAVSVPRRKRRSAIDSGHRYPSLKGGENCDALPLNNPPIIYSQPVADAMVGSDYSYDVDGHDPDADQLLYSLVNAPQGMSIDQQSGLIKWTPGVEQEGDHSVEVKVTDSGGMQASQLYELFVERLPDQLSVRIIANPVSGTSPLKVRFSPDVQNNNLVITKYQWDFNGDGQSDLSDTFGAPKSYTYSGAPGDEFTANLTIFPAGVDPVTVSRKITITNQPPTVQVSANMTNGHAPLSVLFTVTAQDPQGIGEVSIDFDGDGRFDEVQPGGSASSWQFHTVYLEEGRFVAQVMVTDVNGAETFVANHAITVDVNNPLDPVVQLTVVPDSGDAPLAVTLTAAAVIYDGSTLTQWAWDLDGDGEFETRGGADDSDSILTIYHGVGSYYPVVEVTTSSGRTARASLIIRTSSTTLPSIVIPDSSDTINVDASEVASINVNLPFETDLELWIEDADGSRVKTLFAEQKRSAGTFEFSWDGSNEQGAVAPAGDYYAVLGYTANARKQEIDLRTSTGGQLTYYRRTKNNPRTFDRLESPLIIDYEVHNPAEVTFFWQISWGQRLMTLLEHYRMGRGHYSLMWNGEYPGGEKVPDSMRKLLPGIVRYNLPENVIFVKHNPSIDAYRLSSTIVADPRREPIGIDITLSKPGRVEMVVADMKIGSRVATRLYADLPAGINNLSWDGRNNDDQFLAPGDYRIGVRSVDEQGSRSLYLYRTLRLQY
jgi:PKD repeat protein